MKIYLILLLAFFSTNGFGGTTSTTSVVNFTKLAGNSTVQINLNFPNSSGTPTASCFSLTNSTANVYFIPYASQAEWTAFTLHTPAGITIASCSQVITPGCISEDGSSTYGQYMAGSAGEYCTNVGSACPDTTAAVNLGKCYTDTTMKTVVSANRTGLFCSANLATCQPSGPINGLCGAANGNFYDTAASVNSAGLCSAGTPAPLGASGAGPWIWSCLGQNGGASASCNAQLATCYLGVVWINTCPNCSRDQIDKIFKSKDACDSSAATGACQPTDCKKQVKNCVFGHPMSWASTSPVSHVTCMEYQNVNSTFHYTTLSEGQCVTLNATSCFGASGCNGSMQACCTAGVVNACNPNADPTCTGGNGSMSYGQYVCQPGANL